MSTWAAVTTGGCAARSPASLSTWAMASRGAYSHGAGGLVHRPFTCHAPQSHVPLCPFHLCQAPSTPLGG